MVGRMDQLLVLHNYYWSLSNGNHQQQSFSDLTEAGYSTTIGPAQFHEAKQNMGDPDHAMQVCLRPGRPAKVCC
jgi:hypothetical protein